MPAFKRIKTNYPGVYYVIGTAVGSNKPERIYYIRYRKGGKPIEEKAGRQFQDDMTPARAAGIRALRIQGEELSNKERREAKKTAEEAKAGRWTIDRLWQEYKAQKPETKALRTDENRYKNHLKAKFGNKEPKDLIQELAHENGGNGPCVHPVRDLLSGICLLKRACSNIFECCTNTQLVGQEGMSHADVGRARRLGINA